MEARSGAIRKARIEKAALGCAPTRPMAPMRRNTACGIRRRKARSPSPARRSATSLRPATIAMAARPGTRAVPVELGHWLYMVSASAGILSSMPPMMGADMIAVREAVRTETSAARPMTHTAMSASEDTFAAWTTEP